MLFIYLHCFKIYLKSLSIYLFIYLSGTFSEKTFILIKCLKIRPHVKNYIFRKDSIFFVLIEGLVLTAWESLLGYFTFKLFGNKVHYTLILIFFGVVFFLLTVI